MAAEPDELPDVEGVGDDTRKHARRPLRPRRPRRAGARRDGSPRSPSGSSPTCPTSSPRRCSRRAASRPARSPTCCCGARGSGCSTRARLTAPGAEGAARRRADDGARARLGRRRAWSASSTRGARSLPPRGSTRARRRWLSTPTRRPLEPPAARRGPRTGARASARDGDRQRDPRFVLRPPGRQGASTSCSRRALAMRARRRRDRSTSAASPGAPTGPPSRPTRRPRAWCRWSSASRPRGCSSRSTPGARRSRARRSTPARR